MPTGQELIDEVLAGGDGFTKSVRDKQKESTDTRPKENPEKATANNKKYPSKPKTNDKTNIGFSNNVNDYVTSTTDCTDSAPITIKKPKKPKKLIDSPYGIIPDFYSSSSDDEE